MTTLISVLNVILNGFFFYNFILVQFLGLCSFLVISKDIRSSAGFAMAITFVNTLSAATTWLAYYYILVPLKIEYLYILVFILLIATFTQLIEMIIKRYSPSLQRSLGIFLPLIVVHCGILGSAVMILGFTYSFVEGVVFGVSAGLGVGMVILIMAGIRERLALVKVPKPLENVPITFIIASLLSIVFLNYVRVITF